MYYFLVFRKATKNVNYYILVNRFSISIVLVLVLYSKKYFYFKVSKVFFMTYRVCHGFLYGRKKSRIFLEHRVM